MKTATKKTAPKKTRETNPAAATSDSDAVLKKIAAFPDHYRPIAERLHALILRAAPHLQPALWYGMPAYKKNGDTICFFRSDKYMTFGLNEKANHDLPKNAPHQLRESAWFFTDMDDSTEAKLAAIVRKAAN